MRPCALFHYSSSLLHTHDLKNKYDLKSIFSWCFRYHPIITSKRGRRCWTNESSHVIINVTRGSMATSQKQVLVCHVISSILSLPNVDKKSLTPKNGTSDPPMVRATWCWYLRDVSQKKRLSSKNIEFIWNLHAIISVVLRVREFYTDFTEGRRNEFCKVLTSTEATFFM